MNHRILLRLFLGLLTCPLLTNIALSAPVAPAPAAPAPLDVPISIGVADEAAFFGALNLDLPALAQVKAAVQAKN